MAEGLWGLLDDISTLGDMMKPEHTQYYKAVHRIVEKRNDYFESDGYSLYNPRLPKEGGGEFLGE